MDEVVNGNSTEAPSSRRRTIKYIITAIIILLLSFFGAFLAGKNIFGSPDASGGQGEKVGPLYSSPEFTVNIADTNGRSFLMTQFSLEVDHKRVSKELDKKLPLVQDTVILLLSAQTVEDLNSVDGKGKIKQLLIDNINNILTEGKVINIYFNKFVYQ